MPKPGSRGPAGSSWCLPIEPVDVPLRRVAEDQGRVVGTEAHPTVGEAEALDLDDRLQVAGAQLEAIEAVFVDAIDEPPASRPAPVPDGHGKNIGRPDIAPGLEHLEDEALLRLLLRIVRRVLRED